MITCPLCHQEKLCDGGAVIETDSHYTHKKYIVCSECFKEIQGIIDDREAGKPDEHKLYANWCKILMAEIESIAREKYPDREIWIDTGNRMNACIAMLRQFGEDIKGRKRR